MPNQVFNFDQVCALIDYRNDNVVVTSRLPPKVDNDRDTKIEQRHSVNVTVYQGNADNFSEYPEPFDSVCNEIHTGIAFDVDPNLVVTSRLPPKVGNESDAKNKQIQTVDCTKPESGNNWAQSVANDAIVFQTDFEASEIVLSPKVGNEQIEIVECTKPETCDDCAQSVNHGIILSPESDVIDLQLVQPEILLSPKVDNDRETKNEQRHSVDIMVHQGRHFL